MKNTLTAALVVIAVVLNPLASASITASKEAARESTQAARVGSTSARDIQVMGDYENCTVTYDARKGESRGSGTNTITFRSSASTWTVSYYFGDGNYLMSGSGNLEGKSINVRFDGGRPASLKSSYGSGSCKVSSASRK